MKRRLIGYSINNPWKVIITFVFLTLVFAAALPSIRTDTDPVKMLDVGNPAVVLYNEMKENFRFNDVIVVGIHRTDGKSLFTVEALQRIHQLTWEISRIEPQLPGNTLGRKILSQLQWLQWNRKNRSPLIRLIVKEDIISPSTVDNILLTRTGELAVRPLMKDPPKTEAGAKAILEVIRTNLILRGKLSSDDGSLVGIFIPIEKGKKEQSYYVGERIREITRKYQKPGEIFYLAGLPIAETTFGIEMFIQMAVYAPLAGLLIFLLMFLFFRNLRLIAGPMILAVMSVLWAMGGLVYSGNIVHIMSSMIPIFLMPIALLDSIHIVSHLHDKIGDFEQKADAVWHVMSFLFNPMLFTSITTMVGFMSLAITGIQPVEVFGITVGCGVFVAWFMSMTFVPAFIMLIDFKKASPGSAPGAQKAMMSARVVTLFHSISQRFPGRLAVLGLLVFIVSLAGILRIVVNDNPVRWFKTDHEIRRADRVMNHQLAGTYMTNLVIEFPKVVRPELVSAPPVEKSEEADLFEDEESVTGTSEPIQPDLRDYGIIAYMEEMQTFLLSVKYGDGKPIVGAATSIVDILRKVGKTAFNDSTIPRQRDKIAQYMFLFESGDIKRGKDLWKYITLDYQKAQIWLQLKDGDNQTIEFLMKKLQTFMKEHPPPSLAGLSRGDTRELSVKWTGLTHINNVWQDEMVKGMGYALLGSFAVVFLMMTFLFRSLLWGLISMIPLSFSIVFIYGLIGWTGKPYDMPIAVLSSLALGLSVDFAIHFNQSFRELIQKTENFVQAFSEVFNEPARAIWRNVLVLAIGFLPLLFSELVPYVTVGVFFFIIMLISGMASLLLLPAMIYLLRHRLPGVREYVRENRHEAF